MPHKSSDKTGESTSGVSHSPIATTGTHSTHCHAAFDILTMKFSWNGISLSPPLRATHRESPAETCSGLTTATIVQLVCCVLLELHGHTIHSPLKPNGSHESLGSTSASHEHSPLGNVSNASKKLRPNKHNGGSLSTNIAGCVAESMVD